MEYGRINGKDIIVPKDKIDEVNQKINNLMEIENEVEIIKLDLEDFENQELNMEDIEGLMGMIYQTGFTGPPIIE